MSTGGEPNEARLRRAHRAGKVPVSTSLLRGAGLCVFIGSTPTCVEHAWEDSKTRLVAAITSSPPRLPTGPEIAWALLATLLPVLGALAAVSLLTGLFQTRGSLRPSGDRSNDPHLPRDVGGSRLGRAGFGLGLAFIVCWLALRILLANVRELPRASDATTAARLAGEVAQDLAFWCAVAALVIGLLDATGLRAAWRRSLGQSRSEVDRERRDREGPDEPRAAVRESLADLSPE